MAPSSLKVIKHPGCLAHGMTRTAPLAAKIQRRAFRARSVAARPTRVPCRASSGDGDASDEYPPSLAVAGALGLVAEAEVARSLSFLSQNGCGLPAGAGGLQGLFEGLSYLGVLGVLGASAVYKVRTGSGLPTGGYKLGPGVLLGLAEGVAYLYLLAGAAFLAYAVSSGGVDDVLPPPGEVCERLDREAEATALNSLDPCTYNPSICIR